MSAVTPELVVRPSWSMARKRLKLVRSLFLGAVVICALISIRFGASLLPLVVAFDAAMGLVFLAGVVAMVLYISNASLISGPGYIAWTGMGGRRIERSVTGLELSRVTSDVSGTRLPLLMLAWPGEHRLFRLDVGFWESGDVDRWLGSVGVPVAPEPARPINELDLPAAYQQVLGKPRISDGVFLVAVGGGILIVVTAAIVLFYQ
jgi:hypothetical protein